jgi:antitoxin (DNA-binding transcriptional repressor) of toxin-antitoxin stability system
MAKPNLISTDELRVNFKKVLDAIRNRRPLLLTYRNRPIARIEPIVAEDAAFDADDPFFKLSGMAEPMGALSAEEIDRLLYGA